MKRSGIAELQELELESVNGGRFGPLRLLLKLMDGEPSPGLIDYRDDSGIMPGEVMA